MNVNKLKIPNIVQSMSNDIHPCDIGNQPILKKKDERKKETSSKDE